MKFAIPIALAFAVAGLAACGEATPAAETASVDPAIKETIETRQTNLKDMGAAFKTISDETKKDAPDMAAIVPAAERIQGHATEIGNWFPAGSGPEAGLKTEALAKIWEDRTTFDAAVVKLQEEAGKLHAAAATGDAAAVTAQFPATGGACKNCHDNFRMKEE